MGGLRRMGGIRVGMALVCTKWREMEVGSQCPLLMSPSTNDVVVAGCDDDGCCGGGGGIGAASHTAGIGTRLPLPAAAISAAHAGDNLSQATVSGLS